MFWPLTRLTLCAAAITSGPAQHHSAGCSARGGCYMFIVVERGTNQLQRGWGGGGGGGRSSRPPPPPCDIPSGRCFFTGPWTVTRSPLRMLRRVAAFCRPLRPVLLLVSFPRSRGPVVGVLGVVVVAAGVFLRFLLLPSTFRSSTTCLAAFPCA